ncbi:MAG TPA: hypothetical protein VGF98_00760 [Candidatus Tumulicola sp.]
MAASRNAEMNRITPRGISCEVPVIPPPPPVTISIDGRPLVQYVRAYVSAGRVYAPVSPLLRRLADGVWFDGSTLTVRRAGRQLSVPLSGGGWAAPQSAFVEIGPVLRFLGDLVHYDARSRQLDVRTPPPAPLDSATPYQQQPQAQQLPRAVFTPSPAPAMRPVWTGSPLPRRTPLPSNSGAPP